MLSCREASELVSKGLDVKLSLPGRLGLALHLRMCRHCATYRRQLTQLREVLQRGTRELPELTALHSFTLSAADQARLTRALAGNREA
jgi:hypothetical protein